MSADTSNLHEHSRDDLITAKTVEEDWRIRDRNHQHHIVDQPDEEDHIAAGDVRFEEVTPGLFLSSSNMAIESDFTVKATREPCLMLGVVLEGTAHTQIGDQHYHAVPGQLTALNICDTEETVSHMRGGTRFDMSGIVALPSWLERTGFAELEQNNICIDQRLGEQTYGVQIDVPPALRETAIKLCRLDPDAGMVARLKREAAALEFFSDAMTALQSHHNTNTGDTLAPRDLARIQRVRELLEQLAPEDKVTLEAVARDAGMSVSTLCRHFKFAFDTTVISFVAEQRMTAARLALRNNGLTIAQAAHLAGFSSPTNFSTAFKRRYGVTPKEFAATG